MIRCTALVQIPTGAGLDAPFLHFHEKAFKKPRRLPLLERPALGAEQRQVSNGDRLKTLGNL